MAGQTGSSKLNWPRWQQALLIALLALFVGNRLIMVVDAIAVRAGLIEQAALWGGLQANDPGGEAGFAKAIDLMPDSGLAKAGVRDGDLVRFERSYERLRRGSIGEKLDFTLDHDGVRTNRQLTVEPIQWNEAEEQRNFRGLLNALASLVTMLIGCFILWRGWGNKTAMLLGAALLAQGLNIIALPPWARHTDSGDPDVVAGHGRGSAGSSSDPLCHAHV